MQSLVSLIPAVCNCALFAEVHELPQNHYNDNCKNSLYTSNNFCTRILHQKLFGHISYLVDIVMCNIFRKYFEGLGSKSRPLLIYQPTMIDQKPIMIKNSKHPVKSNSLHHLATLPKSYQPIKSINGLEIFFTSRSNFKPNFTLVLSRYLKKSSLKCR